MLTYYHSNITDAAETTPRSQQIYRKTPIPECDFNKVAKQRSFRTPFLKNTTGLLPLPICGR